MVFKLIIGICKIGFLFGLGCILFSLVNLLLFNCLYETFEFKEATISKLVVNKNYNPELFGIYYEFEVNGEKYSETYMISKEILLKEYESPENVSVIYNVEFPRVNYIKGLRRAFRENVMGVFCGVFFCLFSMVGIKRINSKYL